MQLRFVYNYCNVCTDLLHCELGGICLQWLCVSMCRWRHGRELRLRFAVYSGDSRRTQHPSGHSWVQSGWMYSVVYDWKRTVRSCVARGTQLKTGRTRASKYSQTHSPHNDCGSQHLEVLLNSKLQQKRVLLDKTHSGSHDDYVTINSHNRQLSSQLYDVCSSFIYADSLNHSFILTRYSRLSKWLCLSFPPHDAQCSECMSSFLLAHKHMQGH